MLVWERTHKNVWEGESVWQNVCYEPLNNTYAFQSIVLTDENKKDEGDVLMA